MNKMKKILCLLTSLFILLSIVSCANDSLPLPEVSDGIRGQLGIDKNINEETIDKYLNRQDSVYRDMRMLKDEAAYENIGGDSYLSGFVKGFEVVPFPYLCNVEGLPEEVGNTYNGTTLFYHKDDEYIANYRESYAILEELFPKDKYIFLMCGGGGYAGMMKNMLVALGWDETKIYNTGGYWYYNGKNKVDTTYEINGETHYDFSLVNYHDIDFSTLTIINENSDDKSESKSMDLSIFTKINDVDELNALENEKKSFLVFVYIPGCASCANFYPIVKELKESNQIDIYCLDLTAFAKTSNSISDRVSYSPSLFIYKEGEVVAYLDPTSNEDLVLYSNLESLTKWISEYIDIEILSSETKADVSDCDSACTIID